MIPTRHVAASFATALAADLVPASAAGAQGAAAATGTAVGVDRLSADSLRAVASRFRAGDPPGHDLGASRDGRATYVVVHRTAPGEVEVHAWWDDVIVVQGGRGTLTVGPTSSGGHPTDPGETRGGSIASPRVVPMAPGDVLRVPAGVPHLVTPAAGGPLVYTAVKVRAPAAAGATAPR